MEPEDLAALKQFKKEVDALSGDALLDRWIELRDDMIATELERQKELYLEVTLAGTFGIGEWRRAVKARRKKKLNADRT